MTTEMLFMTTIITVFAMCGPALGGPVGERGALQERAVDMFEYCSDVDLQGGCSKDSDTNVNICESVHRGGSGVSTLVWRGFECTLYLGYNCDGDHLIQKTGKYNLPGKFRNSFHSYMCKRV